MLDINYNVRGADGLVYSRETIFNDGVATISIQGAEAISLNMSPGSVFGYTREGQDLVMQLANGEYLVIEGYFSAGEPPLMLSTNGELTRVVLEGDDLLVVSYDSVDLSGKWADYDQLVFLDLERIEPVVAPILGAATGLGSLGIGAGAAAGLLAINGGGGGGGGGTSAGPAAAQLSVTGGVESSGFVLNASELQNAGLVVSGTADPGATVQVQIGGETVTTTALGDGSWSATFNQTQVTGGEYTTVAHVTATNTSGATTSAVERVVVDTLSENLTFNTTSGDNAVNGTESGQDLVISGQSEAGATVVIGLQGQQQQTVVDQNGNWTVTFPAGTVAQGTYQTQALATVTDAAGNSASFTQMIQVDTETSLTMDTSTAGTNGAVNAAQLGNGVSISGTGEAGSTVELTILNETRSAVVQPDGSWTVQFENGALPTGTYDATVAATITDPYGNVAQTSGSLHIDTAVQNLSETAIQGGTDGVVNAAEAVGGLPLSGVVEPGSTVTVSYGGQSYAATVDGAGNWSATIPAGALPSGQGDMDVTIAATDGVGNTASIVETVSYDFGVENLTLAPEANTAMGVDLVINQADMANGPTLTGTTEPGSSVFVTVGGVRQQATVDGAGNWSVSYGPSDIAAGTYATTALVEATDAAGNTASNTYQVAVDTEVSTPEIEAITRAPDGVRSVYTQDHPDTIEVHAIAQDGSSRAVNFQAIDVGNETILNFDQPVANGEQIIVAASDTAENDSDTLVVLDTATIRPAGVYFEVDVDGAALSGFDLGAIDLQMVNGAELTLDQSDLARIAGADGDLVVKGGADDRVILNGATQTATHTDADGTQYNVFSLGADHQVMVEDDIQVVLP